MPMLFERRAAFRCVKQLDAERNLDRRGPVWQRGFHDHALRREEDLRAVACYIVGNPLRAGLVQHVGDYPLWDTIWI